MTDRPSQTASGASITDWSMVIDSGREDSPTRQESLDRLIRRYWNVMIARARASGLSDHDAHDAVQGFVADVVLERNLLVNASPDRGRFRGLLSRSLSNYLKDRRRRRTAAKRAPSGGRRIDSLLDSDQDDLHTDLDAEATFTRHWVATVLRNAIRRVREDLESTGRETEWRVLEARLVRPLVDGGRPVPYTALVEELSLRDVPKAASLLVVGKKALGEAIIDEVTQTVGDPGEVSDEIRELLSLLERSKR